MKFIIFVNVKLKFNIDPFFFIDGTSLLVPSSIHK